MDTIEGVAAATSAAAGVIVVIWAIAKFLITRLGTTRLSLELKPAEVLQANRPAKHILALRVHNVGTRRFKPTVVLLYACTDTPTGNSKSTDTDTPTRSKGSMDTVFSPLHATRRRNKDEGDPILNRVHEMIEDGQCESSSHQSSKAQATNDQGITESQSGFVAMAIAEMKSVIGEGPRLKRMVIDPGETEVFTFVVELDGDAPSPAVYSALVQDKNYEWTVQIMV